MIPSTSCPPPVEDKITSLSYDRIEILNLLNQVQHPGAGGVVLFSGEVRNLNNGREVSYLEYEAEPVMADKHIKLIILDAIQKFNLHGAACIHRIGKVPIGESAVVVVTAHIHRKEAYRANEFIIDRVKHEVPIWKKEFFTDGTHLWGNNCNCH